jgi:hypothetical protein
VRAGVFDHIVTAKKDWNFDESKITPKSRVTDIVKNQSILQVSKHDIELKQTS